MLSFVMNILLAALAVMMMSKGRYGATRQMAVVPLGAAVLDTLTFGAVTPSMTPGLSALLVVLQVVILVSGALVLHRDRVRARNKQARRVRRRELERSRAAFEQALEQQSRVAARQRVCA
ncbi:MAG: hypothetical protein E7527_01375 [Ruminococcaceae bacterium]|nr:hypothetical protein [Oscillospiraceae bacterium]